jgi:hypothetical protein
MYRFMVSCPVHGAARVSIAYKKTRTTWAQAPTFAVDVGRMRQQRLERWAAGGVIGQYDLAILITERARPVPRRRTGFFGWR